MKSLLLIFAAIAQATPGTPAADDFCAGARALAAGAAEATPFQSMRAAQTQFRMGRLACFFAAGGGYICSHNLARPNETRESYATRIATCLPGSTRSTERRDHRDLVIVRSGSLEARISEDGQDHGHVGRSIRVYFASAS